MSAPAGRRGGRWWRLAPVETRMLLRRRTVALSLLAGPLMMVFFAVVVAPEDPAGWGMLAGIAGLVGMLLSVYATSSTVFTLRRESGALARLRTTELSGPGIVAATGTPLFAVGVLQTLLVLVVFTALGAPPPAQPLLLVVPIVLGAAFCVVAGALTSTFSAGAESVQFTVLPLVIATSVAANLLATGIDGPLRAILLLVPGTPVADLVVTAWTGVPGADVGGLAPAVLGPLLLLAWSAVAVLGAAARWRWTPRG
ncbi:ABC transporter permease [Pseudonocardia sp. NPDC046786]|uniref:ABC transporter permease n=1 Tax=Pseudonocardia sp. NPDC046786 TaxID=3155471 RepID=UPI0033CB5705